MKENFRQFLDRLRGAGELIDLHQPVDIRHIATLVDQSDKALCFHNVIGYKTPVVSGIIRSRERAIMAMGCTSYGEIEARLKNGIDHPIAPKILNTSPTREVSQIGDDVDLFDLPIPMSSIYDGGPMITAGVVIARDPELGMNSGIYRFIIKEKNLTGIDLVTPNNMRLFADRAYKANRPCPISISIGTHPIEIAGAGYRAPLGVDEMAIAGGIRGESVELAPCQTIDMPYIADADKDITVTLGGCAFWHAVISIKKQSGEGKNALLAALSVMDLKHVVVVDDDIDVNNPMDVEWAIATRVQGDRDVMIVSNARAKPLDPSLRPMPPGVVPTGAKVGVDATIPEDVPREGYERITYAYAGTAKIADYVKGKQDRAMQAGDADTMETLAHEIITALDASPLYYTEIAEQFSNYNFNVIARALGHLHKTELLWQDSKGRMCRRGSQFAVKLPAR
jgi:3-polyprenyl-4-hydroxybenzoate decarboxylase